MSEVRKYERGAGCRRLFRGDIEEELTNFTQATASGWIGSRNHRCIRRARRVHRATRAQADLAVTNHDSCAANRSAIVRPLLPPRTVVLAVFPAHGGTAQRCARKNRVYATSQEIRTADNRDGGRTRG